MIIKTSWIVVAVLVVRCANIAAQTNQASPASAGTTQAHTSPGPDTPLLQQRYPRYQVTPGDILVVSFPLIPELQSLSVTVEPDGFITLPNGEGAAYVKGETIPQVVDTLTKLYSRTMHNPIVSVNVTNFLPPQFTVNGQVGKPGQYDLRRDTTVSEAIAIGGGFLPTAKTQVFVFHRVAADWVEVKRLGLKNVLNGKHANEDIHLQPGDMIYVPDKFIANFRKYLPYSLGLGTGLGFNGTALYQ
jgi:polysaccharide export outer membrane protein